MRSLTILGSTGSIGQSTLDVVRRNRDRFRIFALAAGWNVDALLAQILEFRPAVAVVATEAALKNLTEKLRETSLSRSAWPELAWGGKGRIAASTNPEVDFLMSAIVGIEGLEATYEAVRRGARIGLANKEVLVAGGKLVTEAAAAAGTEMIPVDSEHNGAHQCLKAGRRSEVTRLILTASGGPFRNTPPEKLADVTPDQALNHPTWKMGRRITIDSATMANKGFEIIEACWLFRLAPREVDVVVHPQSSVHALVEYNDGSVIAQISVTDMRMPIQYALSYPDRWEAPVPRYDWSQAHAWQFEPPDYSRFPLLKLARQALETGGSATCTLNAADEVGVDSFLKGQISFPAIAEVVEKTLDRVPVREPSSIEAILEIDAESRRVAAELSRRCSRPRAEQ